MYQCLLPETQALIDLILKTAVEQDRYLLAEVIDFPLQKIS